jgi:hypothetical protein
MTLASKAKAPLGLSKKDFEAKLDAIVDHLLALPLVQQNVLRLGWCINFTPSRLRIRLHTSSFSP